MKNNKKIFVGLIFPLILLGEFNPAMVMHKIEQIFHTTKVERYTVIINGVFSDDGNLWLSWREGDKEIPYKEWLERTARGEVISPRYIYWYVQKFDATAKPYFPAIEMRKEKPYADGGFGGATIYVGSSKDAYAFTGSDFCIERIDSKGNHYISSKNYSYYAGNMFIDHNQTMYVFSSLREKLKCTKFSIQEPMPVFMEEQILPGWDKPEGNKYIWVHSNLIYIEPSGNSGIFILPPLLEEIPLADTTKINVYRVSLPDLMSVDTSSFRISDALYKKIKGCKLRTKELTSKGWLARWLNVSSLVEGNGDTLVLYLSSRGAPEDLIYVCKLTKDGEPISSKEVINDEVKDFDKAPEKLHREILFRGAVTGKTGEPAGIMIYGFDKSSNVYYYIWDKSDDYWKGK
jgi:hypothetical protein